MDRTRLSLDNPAFEGRLRHTSRSSAYVARSTPGPAKTIQDIAPLSRKFSSGGRPVPPKQITHNSGGGTTFLGNDTLVQKRPQLQSTPLKQTISEYSSLTSKTASSAAVARAPQKSSVLWRGAVKPPANQAEKADKKSRKRSKQTAVLYAMASIVFVVGVAVSLNGLRTNRQVAAQVKQVTSSDSNSSDANKPPSTTKPSDSAVANYAVAPNLPRYIDIAKLSVHARVLSMGVNSKNQLQAPGNVYDAGWYNASAQPGQPGAMLVDGHISSWTTKGVFYGLNKLAIGDPITISRGDGKTFTYKVVKNETVDVTKVDMGAMLVSQNTAKPGLNLISCAGDVIPGTNEFNKRVTVYAVMQ